MSADSWSVCPKCREIDPIFIDENKRHFREDYGFYIDNDGIFTAIFHEQCKDCGFEFSFNHKHNILK